MARRLAMISGLAESAQFLSSELPAYLCPGLSLIVSTKNSQCPPQRLSGTLQSRFMSSTIAATPPPSRDSPDFERWALSKLPTHCPGCGAPSQTVNSRGLGYYDLKRHAIRKYLGLAKTTRKLEQQEIVRKALQESASLNLDIQAFGVPKVPHQKVDKEVVKCFRCRNLLNHRVGISIEHPSLESIRDTLDETSYKYNHIYHVIDAADFPMSVIPDLQSFLNAAPLRSKNRRAKTERFYQGRKFEVSYIITRSDLLAPLKEQVDSMMPYLRLTLRDALGRSATDMRLGNVHCVSVKRDWWTKELKEEVWNRGGAGWMVGKVNVGKSQLFINIFPKGRKELVNSAELTDPQSSSEINENEVSGKSPQELSSLSDTNQIQNSNNDLDTIERVADDQTSREIDTSDPEATKTELKLLDTDSLLPPAPPEVNYPTMPLVSDLPGTTASPIRLLFGNGKGELIDLPGLKRGDLESHVLPAYHPQLVMRSRIIPTQDVIKPGQSLLLGGLIRITPTSGDVAVLAYAFTSIEPHLTSTLKAIGTQTETRASSVKNIAVPGTGSIIASAGKFVLKWDVTKQQTGPVTHRFSGGVSVDDLPYRVVATDILIEGCGWVELVAQVSKRQGSSIIKPLSLDSEDKIISQELEDIESGEVWPSVEVFSPHGKYVAARRPMNAWSFISRKQGRSEAKPTRPIAVQKRKLK